MSIIKSGAFARTRSAELKNLPFTLGESVCEDYAQRSPVPQESVILSEAMDLLSPGESTKRVLHLTPEEDGRPERSGAKQKDLRCLHQGAKQVIRSAQDDAF